MCELSHSILSQGMSTAGWHADILRSFVNGYPRKADQISWSASFNSGINLVHVHYMSSSVRLSVVRPSVCCLFVVCRLSVTFVHPTQTIEMFGNVSMSFRTYTISDLCVKISQRSSQGDPSVGWRGSLYLVKRKPNIAILDLSKTISRKRCKIILY